MKLLLLIPFLFLGCVTTTVTKPDGSVVRTSSQDPAVIGAIASGVTSGIVQGGAIALQRGFAK